MAKGKIIVGMHGLANKPPKEEEANWWKLAMQEGLKKNCNLTVDFEFQVVYWADLLYKSPLHRDENFKFDALYNNEPYIEAQDGALQTYEEGWFAKASAGVLGVGGAALDALKGYMGFDGLANTLLEKTLKDLAFYYEEDRQITDRQGRVRQARRVIQDELRKILLPLKGQRIMLIGHSMGSIVAYDVLRDLKKEDPAFAVAHFVTIGSPLGLPHVKLKVHEERNQEVRTPTIVTERWANYADRRDPVAVDVHLADDYKPNGAGICVVDDLVHNDYPLPKEKPNHHKSYGYLRTPELSKHLQQFILG
ncbi:MAG: alpha/beta hydrolase [Deltaproteobacteria bacterium]|nr:alpha/beta hydrolase [Deltaproteobacteria bacterium]